MKLTTVLRRPAPPAMRGVLTGGVLASGAVYSAVAMAACVYARAALGARGACDQGTEAGVGPAEWLGAWGAGSNNTAFSGAGAGLTGII